MSDAEVESVVEFVSVECGRLIVRSAGSAASVSLCLVGHEYRGAHCRKADRARR